MNHADDLKRGLLRRIDETKLRENMYRLMDDPESAIDQISRRLFLRAKLVELLCNGDYYDPENPKKLAF